MEQDLTPEQRAARARARAFVDERVAPDADGWDRQERLPPDLIEALGHAGYLGSAMPGYGAEIAGDMVSAGLIAEEFGRGCSSVRSLLTVQGMVGRTLAKWGTAEQRGLWPARLAAGGAIAAFALTEPEAGSDAAAIQSSAEPCADGYILHGTKNWVSFGQIADLFLVFARCEGRHAAFLVERDTPGLTIEPVSGLLGLRASMLATLRLDGCRVPATGLVGRPGTGWSHVAAYALDEGRFGVAWGCAGIGRAALEASLRYAAGRSQFGALLRDQQLIQRMITDMVVNVEAARLLCYQAARAKDARLPRALTQVSIAKYFAAGAAMRAATDAVQIHGANGCGDRFPVQRLLRDATIMKIIEGSDEMHQISIAGQAYQEYAPSLSPSS